MLGKIMTRPTVVIGQDHPGILFHPSFNKEGWSMRFADNFSLIDAGPPLTGQSLARFPVQLSLHTWVR